MNKGTLVVGGIMTVFPDGWQNTTYGQAVDQTVLIRVQDTDLVTAEGRETWAPAGYVAYSKLCTHLGCPVGLYEQELELLVCPATSPCSTCATAPCPSSAPPPARCPSCRSTSTPTGNLRAQAGYDQAVGPGFCERTTTKVNGT